MIPEETELSLGVKACFVVMGVSVAYGLAYGLAWVHIPKLPLVSHVDLSLLICEMEIARSTALV